MNTVKILHCADIHIGAAESFLGVAAMTRRYETLLTFEKIVDIAKQSEVSVIAIAGDLFDSNNIEEDLVSAVFEKIASVPEIKVLLTLGNHDPLNSASPLKTRKRPDNLYVFGPKEECFTFEDLKLRAFGKSFENVYMKGTACLSLVPPEDDFINLAVIHGETGSDMSSDYNSITPGLIKNSKMDYIALGHVHKRSEVMKIGGTYFAYPGCPEGQGFDELGEKGVYVGEIGKGYCSLEFVPTAKRQHIYEKIDVSSVVSANEISIEIINTLKKKYGDGYGENLYKIDIIGSVSENTVINLSEITARIADRLYFAKLRDKTELLIDTEKLSEEVSLKGLFVKNMLKRIAEADASETEALKTALNIGLKAFNSEVAYNED